MKVFGLKLRLMAPVVVVCCFVFFGSQSLQAQAPFTSMQTGFSQQVFGTAPPFFGGVAFAPNGDVWVDECFSAGSPLLRFSVGATAVVNTTTVHPQAAGSPFSSNAGCGLTNHPDGNLYSNIDDGNNGVVKLDANTGAQIGATFGPRGNALGITVDPVTNNLVYVAQDCRFTATCTIVSINPASPDSSTNFAVLTAAQATFVDGIAFDTTGNFLFLSTRAPSTALTILNRSGGIVQQIAMTSEPDGIAFHSQTPQFVLTNNNDGTMTRFDFPGNNFATTPTLTQFASGGNRGDLSQTGPDGCLYVSQEGTRFNDNTTSTDNSIVQICGGFASPPSSTPPTSQVETTTVFTDGESDTIAVFNPTPGQQVEHHLLFPAAANVDFQNGITSPQLKVTNNLISNGTVDAPPWPQYVAGGPFATSLLFVKSGDNLAGGGTDIGSMYEDECFDATHAPSEPNCPAPKPGFHIISKDIFDIAPPKPPIPPGTTVSFIHYYPNTIPGITTWSPSSAFPNPVCTDVTGPGPGSPAPASASACDTRDILVSITGDQSAITGKDGRKGAFAGVFNVPMLESTVKVNNNNTPVNTPGQQVDVSSSRWFRAPLTFDFNVTPAQCPTGAGTCANHWVAAPVSNLFYTLNPLTPTPPALPDIPDTPTCPGGTDNNGNPCAVAGTTQAQPGASSTLNVEFTSTTAPGTPADGKYLLQWSAADNVGIRERNAQLIPGTPPTCPDGSPVGTGGLCYTTSLFSAQINVDSTPPTITGPTLSPSVSGNIYQVGQLGVTVTFSCSDGGSGVTSCLGNGTLGSPRSIDTSASAAGMHTFTVTAMDVAGNTATKSVTYQIGPAADLVIGEIPVSDNIKKGTNGTYYAWVVNFSPGTAYGVNITSQFQIPSGVLGGNITAIFATVSCTFAGCSATPSTGSACSVSGNTVSCNVGQLPSVFKGKGVVVKITIPVSATATAGTTFTSVTTVQSANDPKSSNNSVPETFKVTGY